MNAGKSRLLTMLADQQEVFSDEVTYSASCMHPECHHLRQKFAGQSRLRAARGNPDTRYDSFPFFSATSFVFFLPGLAVEAYDVVRTESDDLSFPLHLLLFLNNVASNPRYADHFNLLRAESSVILECELELLQSVACYLNFDEEFPGQTAWRSCFIAED